MGIRKKKLNEVCRSKEPFKATLVLPPLLKDCEGGGGGGPSAGNREVERTFVESFPAMKEKVTVMVETQTAEEEEVPTLK